MRKEIVYSDNLHYLQSMPSETIDLIYIDPPFNTGKRQSRKHIEVKLDPENGDRIGFNDKRYRTLVVSETGFKDYFDEYYEFLRVRINQAYRVLKSTGSLFFHIDYREVHYCKILLDEIFDRNSFMNEIIWAYDYGGRSTKRWPAKHDNILWYAKDPDSYTFHYDEMDRIPYMAPGLVGKKKAARGKTPTDVWWHTIVSPTGNEKVGYATQKPLGIIERIVKVHSSPRDTLLDFFAGSGTLGEAAVKNGRGFILIDNNPDAIQIMAKRLSDYKPNIYLCAELAGSDKLENIGQVIELNSDQ